MEAPMEDIKRKIELAKEKMVGQGKETIGKVTGNESMELKGKIQSAKAEIMDDVGENIHEIKEDIAGKINHVIDKFDHKR